MKRILLLLCVTSLMSGCYSAFRKTPDPVSEETPNREAWLCYAHRYGELDMDRDYPLARRWCREAADKGHHGSRTLIAEINYLGLGGPRDLVSARQDYRIAAENGHAHAQLMLFDLLRQGHGGERDRDEAMLWLRRALRNGDPQAREIYRAIEQGRRY